MVFIQQSDYRELVNIFLYLVLFNSVAVLVLGILHEWVQHGVLQGEQLVTHAEFGLVCVVLVGGSHMSVCLLFYTQLRLRMLSGCAVDCA